MQTYEKPAHREHIRTYEKQTTMKTSKSPVGLRYRLIVLHNKPDSATIYSPTGLNEKTKINKAALQNKWKTTKINKAAIQNK
jgi:hypothetical protein